MPDHEPAPAQIGSKGSIAAGYGARLKAAPTRHTGGANYTFADGHTKWLAPDNVYFSPRGSARIAHDPKLHEPEPEHGLGNYTGAFQLN